MGRLYMFQRKASGIGEISRYRRELICAKLMDASYFCAASVRKPRQFRKDDLLLAIDFPVDLLTM
jgi:hypothetical protein